MRIAAATAFVLSALVGSCSLADAEASDPVEQSSPNIRAANNVITLTADDIKFATPTAGLTSFKAMLERIEAIAVQGYREKLEVSIDSRGACNGNSASIKLNDVEAVVPKRDPDAASSDGLHAVAIDSATHATLWAGIWNTVDKPAGGTGGGDELAARISALPPKSVVAIACKGQCTGSLSTSSQVQLNQALASVGATEYATLTANEGYALIGVRGAAAISEVTGSARVVADTATTVRVGAGLGFTAVDVTIPAGKYLHCPTVVSAGNWNNPETCGEGYGNANAVNLLAGQAGTASSTMDSNTPATLTDGLTCTTGGGGQWHSGTSVGPHWVEIPLVRPSAVGTIVVGNRCDCCGSRTNGARVYVVDAAGTKTQCGSPLVNLGNGVEIVALCPADAGLSVTVRYEQDADWGNLKEIGAYPRNHCNLPHFGIVAEQADPTTWTVTSTRTDSVAPWALDVAFDCIVNEDPPIVVQVAGSASGATVPATPVVLPQGEHLDCPAAVPVVPVPPANTQYGTTNLLYNQVPVVSSVHSTYLASHLTDGVTCQSGAGASGMWHSIGGTSMAWAEIPLPSPEIVGYVVVYNRCDCCDDRLNGTKVFVVDAAGVQTQCGGELTSNGMGSLNAMGCPESAGHSVKVRFEEKPTGSADTTQNVVEIQAFAAEYCELTADTNLLLNRLVHSSAAPYPQYGAAEAVDGITCTQAGGTDTGDNMYHSTEGSGLKWVEVVGIKCAEVIDRVVVINRCNGNNDRITGAKVFAINPAGVRTQCGAPLVDGGLGMPITVQCPASAGASTGVRLEHTGTLNINEIQAFAKVSELVSEPYSVTVAGPADPWSDITTNYWTASVTGLIDGPATWDLQFVCAATSLDPGMNGATYACFNDAWPRRAIAETVLVSKKFNAMLQGQSITCLHC